MSSTPLNPITREKLLAVPLESGTWQRIRGFDESWPSLDYPVDLVGRGCHLGELHISVFYNIADDKKQAWNLYVNGVVVKVLKVSSGPYGSDEALDAATRYLSRNWRRLESTAREQAAKTSP